MRQLIDRRQHLGHDDRIAIGQNNDARAQTHPWHYRRQMTQQCQWFEHVITIDDVHGTWHKQMVRHPYRGKAQLLRTPRHPEHALDVHRFAIVRHTDPKLHGLSPYSVVLGTLTLTLSRR